MNFLSLIIFSFYGIFLLYCLIVLFLKIKERLKEKSDDDNDLDKFKKF